ncbi:MAG: HDIG domain-containing protein [Candidatus Staskawiczbacteria bacterium]|nr:HDIG domain-containing protein [Candidatus Staskawiczbacteria bacterium]
MKRISAEVEPIYRGSAFYTYTIWPHVVAVSAYALEFARQMGVNQLVAKIGGLLHDLGAAKHGRENHHITGRQESMVVLLSCGCPKRFIGSILSTIYSHRGSQKIAPKIPEAICVAAGDAKDHFVNVDELCLVQKRDFGILDSQEIIKRVFEKLQTSWEKTPVQAKCLLIRDYQEARHKLLQIASGESEPSERCKSAVLHV